MDLTISVWPAEFRPVFYPGDGTRSQRINQYREHRGQRE
jgi:hypothetical protein